MTNTFFSIYKYYKKDLGALQLIYKTKGKVLLLISLVIYSSVSTLSLYLIYQHDNNIYGSLIPVVAIILFVVLNEYAKSSTKQLGIQAEKGLLKAWPSTKFYEYRIELLMRYLKDQGIIKGDSEDKYRLNLLAQIASKEADLAKRTLILNGSIFLILFIPLWNQFLGWIYRNSDPTSYEFAFTTFKEIFGVITIISGFVLILKLLFGDLVNFKRLGYLKFQTMIENIQLNIA